MRLEHLSYGQIDILRLKAPALRTAIAPGTEAQLQLADRHHLALVTIGSTVVEVQGEGRKSAELLEDLCIRNLPRLIWIVEGADQTLTVQVHTFLHSMPLPPLDIGVDDKVCEAIRRLNYQVDTAEKAIEWLNDQFFLPGDGTQPDTRALATAGDSVPSGGFALHGRSVRAFIGRNKRESCTEALLIDKIVRANSQQSGPMALMTGALRFVDSPSAEKLRADAAAELSQLVASGSSFLEVWNRYRRIEEQTVFGRAQKARWLPYDRVESLPQGRFRLYFENPFSAEDAKAFKRALSEDSDFSLEAASSVPEFLRTEITWDQYIASSKENGYEKSVIFSSNIELNLREKTITLIRLNDEETTPPSPGFLFLSLRGDKARLERRRHAMESIRAARCPMPQLGLLIEERPVPPARQGNIRPLLPSVKRKVFGDRSPTATQEEALRVALNTPDIALIQGPPGTGKTTIIAALVERLQEVWESSSGTQGRLLLSGFQHDAVENAIQRMSPNGLPPIKFGGRANRREDADRLEARLDAWTQQRADALRNRLPAQAPSALHAEVVAQLEGYLAAPSTLESTTHMLFRLAERVRSVVPAALTDQLIALGRDLTDEAQRAGQGDAERERAVRAARALRCEPVPFADDGQRNAYRLVNELDRQTIVLEAGELKLLKHAADWSEPLTPPFLKELGALRRSLLLRLLSARHTHSTIPLARTDVLAVLSAVRNELDRQRKTSPDAATDAVLAFLSALEEQPKAVREALISYTSVFAATCQQSAHRDLAKLKPSDGYDTVIVDEAARANPLDLFVPLSQARRRIVLVGDHRQLPHILDRELEQQLEQELSSGTGAEELTAQMLKECLFERLFLDLRRREAIDGIRRTVTLDEQYRMHPVLGEFISREFYERHSQHEAFRSPRPASAFVHGLPGYHGPAAWLDVPLSRGQEQPGLSKSRPAEAKAIVAELKRLMDCPAGQQLTFGVITFYSAQVKALKEELKRAAMGFDTEEGLLQLEPAYGQVRLDTGQAVERLRVGTVDAFQGMEFDVVFLSMVRSNCYPDESKMDCRRKFGHLMSPNRLCVAMSRQKRLLIVAGDEAMLRGCNAENAVGPMVRFRQLSEVKDAARL